MKLTDPQRALLLQCPCSCDGSYRPAKALIEFGLAEFTEYPFGGLMLKLTTHGKDLRQEIDRG